MNTIIRELANQIIPININIEESLHDLTKWMDETMIEYIKKNLEDPERKDKFVRAMKRYERLMSNESDPRQALYYYYRMILPNKQAEILSKEFYQKEMRSGSYGKSSDIFDDSEGSAALSKDKFESDSYGTPGMDKGMFSDYFSKSSETSGKAYEVEEFFEKFFSSGLLDSQDKIVLITYLLLGTGPRLRAKAGSNRSGIDLGEIMSNPPPELDAVENRIKDLIRSGVDSDLITGEKILQGYKPENGEVIPSLVSTKRQQVAHTNIQRALKKFIGSENIEDIKSFLFEESLNPKDVTSTISDYLQGISVAAEDLIKAIYVAVEINLKKKTRLSKSKMFPKSSISEIVDKYVKLATEGSQKSIFKVQDLFIAPIVDDLENKVK